MGEMERRADVQSNSKYSGSSGATAGSSSGSWYACRYGCSSAWSTERRFFGSKVYKSRLVSLLTAGEE